MAELIPGTALPIQGTFGSPQPEGRGNVELNPMRQPPSMIDPNADRPSLSAAEMAFVRAAIASYDRRPRKLKTVYDSTAGRADASTGNLILPLYVVPAGCEGHVTQVTIDAPTSATITPSAPFSNASSWAWVALGGASSGPTAANVDTFRNGLVAFAPVSAAGPFIPGQWTFNDTSAPIGYGGDQVYFCLHGGSIAALQSLTVQVTYRVDLYGFEDGQL